MGREGGKQLSNTTGQRRTLVLCPCQALSHVLSVKPWKRSPLERPSQAGDRPFNTPWICLKLFCLHHPDVRNTQHGNRTPSKEQNTDKAQGPAGERGAGTGDW